MKFELGPNGCFITMESTMARTTRRAVSLITMLVALVLTAPRVPAFAQNAVPSGPAGALLAQ